MNPRGQPRLLPERLAVGGLAVLILAGTGCASWKRDLRPMTDAEAIERHQHDPRFADHHLSPWERARHDQELRLELDRAVYQRNH